MDNLNDEELIKEFSLTDEELQKLKREAMSYLMGNYTYDDFNYDGLVRAFIAGRQSTVAKNDK